MNTIKNIVYIHKDMLIDDVVTTAFNKFAGGEPIVCLAIPMKEIDRYKKAIQSLVESGCNVIDVFEEHGYFLHFLDNPSISCEKVKG